MNRVAAKLFALEFLLAFFAPTSARAELGFVGGGAGVAKPYTTRPLGFDEPADVGLGYALRGFGWGTPSESLAVGITGLHVGAPSADRTSTLSFVGLGGGFGSGFHAPTVFMIWLAAGVGYSKGACAADWGGELGMRLDRRVAGSFRVGGSVSFTGVLTGCSGDVSDSGGRESRPALLGSALVATLDFSFEIGAQAQPR